MIRRRSLTGGVFSLVSGLQQTQDDSNRRPGFDKALKALQKGETLVITTLDRLGRSTANMLDLAKALRERGIGLRVLNLGGGDVDTSTPIGSMVFTVMAALAQMELEIKRERITDSVSKRRGRQERRSSWVVSNGASEQAITA